LTFLGHAVNYRAWSCGRGYFGKRSRPLEVHIKDHINNLTRGLLEKSELAQLAYEEDHRICWKRSKVLAD
jgi:hypothetical protein